MKLTKSDKEKNWKAAIITLAVHALLLLVFFLFAFKIPEVPPAPLEEGIEVNLGNSDIGFGDVQPLQPDEPAPIAETNIPTPQPQQVDELEDKEKETTEREDAEAPEINKPSKKTFDKKNPVAENKITTKNKKPTPEATMPPVKKSPPKPKALFTGGNGTGGNGQDSYNNSTNQGIAGGSGDQGKPGGNPNSDSYSGNGGNGTGGPRVISGNRKIVKAYSFQGDLDKATIYAIIKVSPSGKGAFQGFGKNSTSRNQAYANAIIEYLPKIQFNPSADESMVTVQFNFSVRD